MLIDPRAEALIVVTGMDLRIVGKGTLRPAQHEYLHVSSLQAHFANVSRFDSSA